MRVLLSADAVGGVWDYAATLANGLAAGRHSVLLACVGRPTAELRATLDPAIRVEWAEHRLEWMAERDEEIAAAAAWLRSLAEAWGADLVHLNQLAYSAQAFGAPTLVVAHSDVLSWFGEVRGAGAPPEWARYARWVRDGLAGATAVVAVSRYQSELLARHHGTGADRVIHNGAAAPPHSPPPLRSPVVISAGRAWDEAKGAVVLDRALAHLGADAPETHLFGALEGPAGQRFTPGRVAAHGRTPRGELERWMERAEIFVSASLYEPFGLAPLEAAQRGCALLLSNIGSYRELWEGCAAFFPAGDASALAEALRSLRGDPERLQALAAAARERATTRYTAARMVTDYLALYGELVDAGAAAPVAAEPLSSGTEARPKTGESPTRTRTHTRTRTRTRTPMRLTFFGSSIVSSYWNGAATYYRGIVRALHALGHEVTFCEPDAYGRQEHRDLEEDPEYATVVVYRDEAERDRLVETALARSDWVIKCSGVGVWDAELEEAVARGSGGRARTAFLDVDAPATLARIAADPDDPFRGLIPMFDHVLTYGGGPPVVEEYGRWGARACTPIYNGVDPDEHRPPERRGSPRWDLLFMGNRLPDREARVEEFFLRAAELSPQARFALGGEGWGDREMPANVEYLGHVPTARHNEVNASARLVLNIHRESMARTGWSPATRMFEAAGAAACQVTDPLRGLEEFFTPGAEILVAEGAEDVARHVREVSEARAREIGEAARRRAVESHSYASRAALLHSILTAPRAVAAPAAVEGAR